MQNLPDPGAPNSEPFIIARLRLATGTVTNLLRFPGQYYDAETRLHYNYNWHRFYDPSTGRYISDPIGLAGEANLYTGLAGSPGIGDKFNPFGTCGDGVRDYTDYFNNRFPKTISGSKALMMQRTVREICANVGKSVVPGLSDGAEDIDISSDMKRFGDKPQNWYKHNVQIGNFQLKTDNIQVK